MRFLFVDLMDIPAYDCDTPYTRGIGGTQSALCYYAEALAKSHEVTVMLCNAAKEKEVRGVRFCSRSVLTTGISADVLIWCSGVTKSVRPLFAGGNIKASLKVCWIPHNVNEPAMNDMEDVVYDFDVFAFVSEWQRKHFIDVYSLEPARTMLMFNGISPGFQGDFDLTAKKPRFLYLSQPDRGLSVLADAWPAVVAACPTAELHTYSSRKLYGATEDADPVKDLFARLRAMPNVTVNDPVGQTELVRVCREASFFAYPTDFYETGCIALTEACAAGCLPIVSELGALGTYFTDCLTFDDTIVEQFTKRAIEYVELFEKDRMEFYKRSERVAVHFQTERDYTALAVAFVAGANRFLKYKKQSVDAFKRGQAAFSKNDYRMTRLHLDNMVPFFEEQSHAFHYFLWLGVANFHAGAYKNAAIFFNKAARWDNSLQLCINMILTYEKLEDEDNMVKWCEAALKYKFNMAIIYKILNVVQKKPYFDRCKWGKYLLSLFNDDIQSQEWMTLFLSHGNMVSNDYTLVMRHEECITTILNLLVKGFAYIELNKTDLSELNTMRGNIEKIFSNLFLDLNYCETRNPEYFKYVQYYQKSLPALKDVVKPRFAKIPRGSGSSSSSRKLRIGFLTGDLVYHPVSYVLNGIVEHMDKERFEIHIFSTTKVLPDNMMQNKIRKFSTAFHDLKDAGVHAIRDKITASDIDVLIEMTGHTTNGSEILNILRYKPARVIANYFAFPNTYGIPEIDYKIGDSVVFPKGIEKYYTEDLCKIEGGFHTYRPIMDIEVAHTPHEGIVFGCTNNPKKYRPDWIKSVAAILNGVPGSKIKMRYFNLDDPSIQEFYWKEFEKHGIARERVDLGLGETLNRYFEAYSDIDICLDPYPYNGGTINIEILYVGLPYVTLMGNSYVSRVGASILHQVGHPELIARTEKEYVKMAVDLALDKERLATYKRTIRDDMLRSSLGDNKKFVTHFEKGLVQMLEEKKWFA